MQEKEIIKLGFQNYTMSFCLVTWMLVNERGAGRKPKADEKQIKEVLKLREQGCSYQKISETMDLAVGTVFNIVKNNS